MRIRHASKSGPRDGVALAVSLVVLTVLMTVTSAFFVLSSRQAKRIDSGFDDRRARTLAESGLSEAYEAIRGGGTGGIGSQAAPVYLGGGVLWVEAVPQATPDTTLLRSIALVGSGRAAISSLVSISASSPLFETTLNSDETLTLNADVMIDSFDSSLGTYASQMVNSTATIPHADYNGDARSNQDIIINSRAMVLGDAIPGPTFATLQSPSSYVTGSTTPAAEPYNFPALALPTNVLSGSLTIPNNGSGALASGDHELQSISVGKDATLTITGPATILLDDFTGNPGGQILVDATAGPVTINIRNSYSHMRLFEVNAVSGSPAAIAFMYEGTDDIVFPSGTAIRGAYYVPNASIAFTSNNECWGAFAGKRIEMSNAMRFHFDEDLKKHWEANNGQPVTFEIEAWGVAVLDPDDYGERRFLGDRRDPMTILGVTKGELLSPSEAWEIAP